MMLSRAGLVVLAAVALAGCSTSRGEFPASTQSQTNLTRANFRVVEGNVMGRDTGFYLFGFIPIVSPSYGSAMHNLRAHVGMSGRATALSNVTQDQSTIYLLLFSLPRITITADVIEFLPEGQNSGSPRSGGPAAAAAPPGVEPSAAAAPVAAPAVAPLAVPVPAPTHVAPAAPAAVTAAAPLAASPSAAGEPQFREFCVEASADLNYYGGQAHAVTLLLMQLASTDGFLAADVKKLSSLDATVDGMVGQPIEHTVYPGSTITLQVVPEAGARYLGTVARYNASKGDARGYRSINDAGAAASCISLGRSELEEP